MNRRRTAAAALAFAATTVGTGTTGASDVASAQLRFQAAAGAGLPDALRRAAIATRSDTTGEIAGARIGDTGTYVIYIRTANSCGSGGCRAQIWRSEGDRFVRGETLPVGRLPIVVLPQMSNGMPVLGVTARDARNAGSAILPVGFDGTGYMSLSDLLPARSGRSALTLAMLRPF